MLEASLLTSSFGMVVLNRWLLRHEREPTYSGDAYSMNNSRFQKGIRMG